jgi:hypothetical protein
MPNLGSCLSYNLFGVDQASSIANIANAAAPLTVVGSPTYEAACVLLDNTNGFSTPFSGVSLNRTCIVICTDDYTVPASLPVSVPTLCAFNGGFAYVSWNGGAQFLRQSGASLFFRSGENNALDIIPSFGGGGGCYYFPDGTIKQSHFHALITTVNSSQGVLFLQNGTAMEKTSLAHSAGPPSIAASPTRIGLVGASSSRCRFAAFAEFTALSDAQALASVAYMAAAVEARGIDFWAPYPGLP